MTIEHISIGLACTLLGLLISYTAFSRNKTKDDKNEGQQTGVILTELGYVKANTDEIKTEQREQRKINTEMTTRLAKVEASAKQAHLRIDRIEGHEYPTEHNTHE